MSKEIRVALLALVAIAVSYWGYNFIIGKNLLAQTNFYYVEYEDVGGLQTSTEVRINGVQVGRVGEITNQLDEQKVLVRLDLDPDIRIPKTTKAFILTETFMGAKAVELRYDRYCSGDDCASDGDYIQGEALGMLSSMIPKDEMNVYLDEISSTLKSLVTTLNEQMLSEDAQGPLANSLRDLESTMGNLKSSTGQLNRLIYRSSDELSGSLDNINTLTNTLADNNEAIGNILQNTDKFTSQLGELDLKATVEELETTVSALKATIQKAETTFAGVNQVVDGIEQGDGTLGKLFQDPDLYYELSTLSERADSLINDIQSRPYRYVPLKSRKRVKRYDRKDEALEEGESGN